MSAPRRERLPGDAVLIVGAGLAGLYLALKLAPRPAVVLTTSAPGRGASSAWAQGGIAAALGPDDTPDAHAADTIAAGAGLVDPDVALRLAREGPSLVRELAALGVEFDTDAEGNFALGLEAAHSRHRVARVAGDLAGREIMRVVATAAAATLSVIIRVNLRAVDLLMRDDGRVGGVLAASQTGDHVALEAGETALATGGVGGLFAVTTNPASARGDAVAMAARAGAVIADPEFVQFHPTATDIGRDPAPLATEALRGEGATLVDRNGDGLVDDPRGGLAPRSVVARAVHRARAERRGAFLDARSSVGENFPDRFPTVFTACQSARLDPRTDLIPVAPAAHYHMGGVATDAEGRSSVPGLWALGEAASTGAHGANRLASNSLLEAVVFAARAAQTLNAEAPPPPSSVRAAIAPPSLSVDGLAQLRAAMDRGCGVERDRAGLNKALSVIDELEMSNGPCNALVAARIVAQTALDREESRGAHVRTDFPDAGPEPRRTMFTLSGHTRRTPLKSRGEVAPH